MRTCKLGDVDEESVGVLRRHPWGGIKFGGEKVRAVMNTAADAVMDVVGAW